MDTKKEFDMGSVAESKVFTASRVTLPEIAAKVAPTTTVTRGSADLQTVTSSNGFGGSNHIGGGANLTTAGNGVVAGQSIDLTLLHQNPASSGAVVTAFSNPMVNPLGPSSEIPSFGVEIPDESVASLDVEIGGLDFGTTGSAFNTVVQHGTSKVMGGAGDMIYSNLTQSKMDTYSAAAEKETVLNNPVLPPTSASAFQNQQRNQPAPGSMIIDSLNFETVPIPPNTDNTHSGSLSSVQSQNTKVNNVPQSPQAQQQQPSYGSSANNAGSAFVTYNTKPAPGFPAPGFPPVVSQIQQPGTYGVPQGPGYGSSSNPMIMHQQATVGYHEVGFSTYGTQPLVSASVQPSQLPSQQIPSQGYTQWNNSTYGLPGMSSNPSQNTTTIPNSSTSTFTGYGAHKSSLTTPGLSGKETANDVSNATTSASSGQLCSSGGLQSNSVDASSTTGPKVPTDATSVTNSSIDGSKFQSGVNSALPPGMTLQPQYILNQAEVLPCGFQGHAMYGYDESQQGQFLPRLQQLACSTVPIPLNIDNTHSGSLSSVQSQNTKLNNVPQSPEVQQQQPSSGSSPNNTGSARNSNPSPGFPAPGNNNIMTFWPTIEELKNFPAYINYMEKMGAHRMGIAKIVPPSQYTPSIPGYETVDIQIRQPIVQNVTGSRGTFQVIPDYEIEPACSSKVFRENPTNGKFETPNHTSSEVKPATSFLTTKRAYKGTAAVETDATIVLDRN